MDYRETLAELDRATGPREFFAALEPYALSLGFSSIAMGELVPENSSIDDPIGYVGEFDAWIRHYSARRFALEDPGAILLQRRRYRVITWDMIRDYCSKNSKANKIFVEAEAFGIYDGMTILLVTPRMTTGFVKLDGPTGCIYNLSELDYLRLVALCQQVILDEVLAIDPGLAGATSIKLTPRGSEVLPGVLAGLSNKQIANRHGVSEDAIKSQVDRLYHDFDIKDEPGNKRVMLSVKATLAGFANFRSLFSRK